MLDMKIVRDINALCEFRQNLCQRTRYLIDKKCSVSLRFGLDYLTKEEHNQYKKELEFESAMESRLNTMLDSIDKEIESNITKFLRGI